LLIVADQYGLNPFTREVFAFPDKGAGIVPVVSVDGWARILNDHAQFDGLEFVFGPEDKAGLPAWCECIVYRKDRSHPITVREYFAEVRRDMPAWRSHPRRMLRHKALIQCARIAFGFSGIYDQDEAERIVESATLVVDTSGAATRTDAVKQMLAAKPAPEPEPEPAPEDDAPPYPISDERAEPPPEVLRKPKQEPRP
jgi:hypothetical protein